MSVKAKRNVGTEALEGNKEDGGSSKLYYNIFSPLRYLPLLFSDMFSFLTFIETEN